MPNSQDDINSLKHRVTHLETLENFATGTPPGSVISEGPGIDLVGTQIGLGGDSILLYHANGNPVSEFAATDAGLDLASAAAATGDRIEIPQNANLSSNHTLIGCNYFFHAGATVSGKLIAVDQTKLYDLNLVRAANDANSLVGIDSPSTGIAYLYDCRISSTQSGAGTGYGIEMLGAGEIYQYGGYVYGSSENVHNTGLSAWAKGSLLDTGDIPGSGEDAPDGVEVSGLTVGQFYCIESSGGPFYYREAIPANAGYGMSANNVQVFDINCRMGFRVFSDNRWYDDPPGWSLYSERVGSYYYRFYFQATTTSVWLWVWDNETDDNAPGDLTYSLYPATQPSAAYHSYAVESVQSGDPLAGERSVFDALNFPLRHANDIDNALGIHWSKAYLDGNYKGTLLNLLNWYDAKVDGDCVGDGVTDDTDALQALITYATANGTKSATIYFPPGVYLIGGALQDTGAGGFNGQILLPDLTGAGTQQISITFRGAARPPYNATARPGLPNPDGYSIIKSTLAGATGNASCISGGHDRNNISIVLHNLLFCAPDNPTFTFIDLSETQAGAIDDIQIATVGGYSASPVQPTNSNAYGIKLPRIYNANYTRTDGLSVGEFYTCILDGELAIHKGLVLGNCVVCIEEEAAAYPSIILNVQMTGFQYGIRGSGAHYLDVINYCAEHVTAAGWRHTIYDVDDPGNYITGHIRWLNAATGGTADHSFAKNGGANVLSEEMGSAPSPVQFPISPSNVYDLAANNDVGVDDSYTKALLHMDGADASTTFTDESGKSWTPAGSAQIDTAQSKFSGASGLFAGAGDYIYTPDNIDLFFDANFTIDMWVRPHLLPTGSNAQVLYEQRTDVNNQIALYIHGDGKIYGRVVSGGSNTVIHSGTHAMANDTAWYHIAWVRNGTSWKIYIDGNAVASQTTANGPANYTGNAYIGDSYNGWIDEVRISKGIARWVADFTPLAIHYGPASAPQLNVVVADLDVSVADNIPQWVATGGDKLSAGLGLVTSIGTPGEDTNIPTEKAVRDALGGSLALDDISDVNAPAPDDQDVLTWDDGAGEWISQAPPAGGAIALDDLTDVNAASPSDQDVLTWDNGTSKWIAQAPPAGGVVDASDVTYTPAVNTDWDGDADPGNADAALDQLAERVDDLEAAPGGGAPTTSEYITTAADGGLSAEVVIPGLAGSPDIAGAAGAGTSEEYDTATTGLTWDVAPAVVDSDTTIKSHLYISTTAGENIGTKAWSPAGAFDARTKVLLGTLGGTQACDIGLYITNADSSVRALVNLHRTANIAYLVSRSYTYASSTWTQRGVDWTITTNELYLRITRDGSNNLSFYWSHNGIMWVKIATQALTLTVTKLGYRVSGDGTSFQAAVDWLRTDV